MEVRPWVEKLIHRAKKGDYRYVNSILYTSSSQKKLFKEIAPRFEEHNAGFTKIQKMGPRANDRAEMAIIELVDNPYLNYERQVDQMASEELGRDTYWQWELKLLRQEQQYFKNLLDDLQDEIDQAIDNAENEGM